MRLGILMAWLVFTAAIAHGQQPPDPPIPAGQPLPQVAPRPAIDPLLAMLADRGSSPGPERRTSRRKSAANAHAPGSLRARFPAGTRPATGSGDRPSPKELADEAGKSGFADFARFREVFLAKPGEGSAVTFMDPSASFLNLLRQVQHVESCRMKIRALDRKKSQCDDGIHGRSGQSSPRLEYDHTFEDAGTIPFPSPNWPACLSRCPRRVQDRARPEPGSRDRPQPFAALALEPGLASRSRTSWPPRTTTSEISRRSCDRFPRPADLTIDGLSLVECQQKDDLTAFLAAAGKRTIVGKDRAIARSRIRNLATISARVPGDMFLLLLSVRRRESALARIIAPPRPSRTRKGCRRT